MPDLKSKSLVIVMAALLLFAFGFALIPQNSAKRDSGTKAASVPTEAAPSDPAAASGYLIGEYPNAANPSLGGAAESDWWGVAARLGLSLTVVVALIYGCIWFLRRIMHKGAVSPRGLGQVKVLETTFLAPQQSLHLVSVGNKVLVLGTTQTQISFLTELDPGSLPVAKERSQGEMVPENFTALFRRVSDQFRPRRLSNATDPKAAIPASPSAEFTGRPIIPENTFAAASPPPNWDPLRPLALDLQEATSFIRSQATRLRAKN